MLKTYLCFAVYFGHLNCQYDNAPADIDIIEEEDARTMPPELAANTKTDFELAMEDCMEDYVNCYRTLGRHSREKLFCAINEVNGNKRTFDNVCHMAYESCKGKIEEHNAKMSRMELRQ